MRKIILLIFIILAAALLLLMMDYHSYHADSKTAPCTEDGLIMTLTTFDGKSESELFIPSLGHSWIEITNR